MKKKWQIMRFNSGKQECYNIERSKWQISNDRWDNVFEASAEKAREVLKKVLANFRKVIRVTTPKLYEIT